MPAGQSEVVQEGRPDERSIMLVDVFDYALAHPAPATVVLLMGPLPREHWDLALARLRDRGYRVVLVRPDGAPAAALDAVVLGGASGGAVHDWAAIKPADEADIVAAEAAFDRAKAMMANGSYNLVVLDEINIAMRYDYLSTDAVLEGLKARDSQTSVILTGRDAKPELCDYADLVSEMVEVKHPFKAGLKAKRGVDF